jgi:hypothetical protein
MTSIKEISKLAKDVSQAEGDELARKMLQDPEFSNVGNVKIIAQALTNIGNRRTEGIGFSEDVSDAYAEWVSSVFDESDSETALKLAAAMFQLPSKKAYFIAKKLHSTVSNAAIKSALMDAICYAGT